MRKYEINLKKFALLLLPTFLRQPVFVAITYAAVSPLSGLHTRFLRYRNDTHYRLTHNGQVCYLRATLNDLFDPFWRRITITDAEEGTRPGIIHPRGAGYQFLISPRNAENRVIVAKRDYSQESAPDFIVSVPFPLSEENEGRLAGVVNTNKLASKRFKTN